MLLSTVKKSLRCFSKYFPVTLKLASVEDPILSVVIISFNYGKYLERALNSALKQRFPGLEILLVEGGSTDDYSRSVAYRLAQHPIKFFQQASPSKIWENRALGLKHARGKYVVFLDADDQLAEGYLKRAVFVAEKFGVEMVSGLTQETDAGGQLTDRRYPSLGARVPDIFLNNRCNTATLFDRKFALKKVKRYPQGMELEDWIFWAQLASYGARYACISDSALLYTVHGKSLTDSLKENYSAYVRKVHEMFNDKVKRSNLSTVYAWFRQKTRPLVLGWRRALLKNGFSEAEILVFKNSEVKFSWSEEE